MLQWPMIFTSNIEFVVLKLKLIATVAYMPVKLCYEKPLRFVISWPMMYKRNIKSRYLENEAIY